MIPGKPDPQKAKIESIDPIIDPTTRTTQIRITLFNPEELLKPNLYLKITIQSRTEPLLAIPENAVLSTGTRETVFVSKGEGIFEPRDLKIGKRGTHYVEVISGLSEGETVVTSANFLIDSESKLKATLSGGSGEMEEHQH